MRPYGSKCRDHTGNKGTTPARKEAFLRNLDRTRLPTSEVCTLTLNQQIWQETAVFGAVSDTYRNCPIKNTILSLQYRVPIYNKKQESWSRLGFLF